MSRRQVTLHLRCLLGCAAACVGAALPLMSARADVTETKAITLDMAIAKINSTDTERYSGDKKRVDTETRCEGFLLSMICGDVKGGEITRLDKSVSWQLEPAKKRYVEKPFPTPEQREEARKKLAEMMEKMKSCPVAPQQPSAPDTSKCQMSPAKFDVKKTDETATIAGHQARRSTVTMTQTCTNPQTGDACDIIVGVDSWLTQDEIGGAAEEKAFRAAYAKKIGLDETAEMIKPQMQTLLAPYADALRQANIKAGDLKGHSLKTAISISMGGEHCAAAKERSQQASSGGGVVANASEAAKGAAENATAGAAGNAVGQAIGQSTGGGITGAIAGSAAGAFGSKLLKGMMSKKSSPPKPDAAAAPAAGSGAPVATLVKMTVETTAIASDPVPGDQFEIPANWKLYQPKEKKEREFQCPAAGSHPSGS